MLSTLVLVLAFAFAQDAVAQYYFNDIVARQQASDYHAILEKQGVTKVTARAFERGNRPAEDFVLEQTLSNGASLVTTTSNTQGKPTVTRTEYNNGRLYKTTESALNVLTETSYSYGANGLLQELTIASTDTFMQAKSVERHLWYYNEAGNPSRMLKIKDGVDSTVVTFVYDEKGNVAEEKWMRKGRNTETYYYYYNTDKRLTDIVRFNYKAQRMLPDFIYEYDDKGRVTKLTQIPSGSSSYLIWTYTYNDRGLKETETCTTKFREPLILIRYRYEF